jgi:hypothetical protein
MTPPPRRFVRPLVAAVCAAALTGAAHGQGAPLPPARPASLDAPSPARPTISRPVDASPATMGDDDAPVTLPPAPRARMHACGVEWRRKKMNNDTGGLLWREFARACLTR